VRIAFLGKLRDFGYFKDQEEAATYRDFIYDMIDKGEDVSAYIKKYTKKVGTLRGAYYRNGKWDASIRIKGHAYWLGNFPTEEEAHKAYLSAKNKLEEI
jgi:hypothetical protein